MKEKYTYLWICAFFCVLSQNIKSSEPTNLDSLYKQSATRILDDYFTGASCGKNTIIYSIGTESYVVIIENTNSYDHYIIFSGFHEINGIVDTTIVNKPHAVLCKAFNPSNYLEGFTNIESPFFRKKHKGTMTFNNSVYFVLIDANGRKHGEARLPIVINPNPIPKKTYNYLYSTLISAIQSFLSEREAMTIP